jgi:PadR family transcriptional regulator, regulatory protein AphA
MEYQLVTKNEITYLDLLPQSRIMNERDALDVVAACGENGVERVMLHAENLPEEFFHLRSGLAGIVLLKLSNYSIRCSAVLPAALVQRGHFYEMALETNRGNQFRIFSTLEPAEAWLLSD